MTDLPLAVSTRIRPRPLFARYLYRLEAEEHGMPMYQPSEAEIRDAIVVLQEGPMWADGLPDPVLMEATRLLDEHGR